ncbi:hypothetical protein L6452_22602 [Arctium lappa]|uniref:Uncharacterized protein n=1 Tax=Arctium lappa TaxID=4217 RepID=A0ACB9B1I6_ARCLA|nr:hypothetical protein L6452_22602 [Arctium lappa]
MCNMEYGPKEKVKKKYERRRGLCQCEADWLWTSQKEHNEGLELLLWMEFGGLGRSEGCLSVVTPLEKEEEEEEEGRRVLDMRIIPGNIDQSLGEGL